MILKVVPQVDCPQTSSSVPHASGRLSVLGWFHNCTEKSMSLCETSVVLGLETNVTINYVCVLMFPVNFLTPWTAPVNVVQHLHLDVVLRNRRNRWVSIPTFLSGPAVQCIDFYGYPILIHFVFGIHFWSWNIWISQQFTLKNRSIHRWFFLGLNFWPILSMVSSLFRRCTWVALKYHWLFFGCTCQCTLQKVRKKYFMDRDRPKFFHCRSGVGV